MTCRVFAYTFNFSQVGLGDIFLEPEVILGQDLFYFPILFLIGFTFLAAFLAKFALLVMSVLHRSRKGYVESILERLKDDLGTSKKESG